jgi:hypothetical protein
MFETKSLTNSIKGELYDDLLILIDQEYLGKSIVVPAELVPYMRGKKFETEEESIKILQIYDGWTARIERTLGREKDATQQGKIVQEILNSLPEPYKTGVVEALKKLAAKGKIE